MPKASNPILQEGNVDCGVGQQGHVWFLTGTFNESGVVSRTCRIPAGTALFFPVLNVECSTLEAPPFFGADAAGLVDIWTRCLPFQPASADIEARP